MNNQEAILKFKETTNVILRCFFNVYNELGYGFLEKVYHSAMLIELGTTGFEIIPQPPLRVYFKGNIVGEFFADFVVNRTVIVELKQQNQLLIHFMLSY